MYWDSPSYPLFYYFVSLFPSFPLSHCFLSLLLFPSLSLSVSCCHATLTLTVHYTTLQYARPKYRRPTASAPAPASLLYYSTVLFYAHTLPRPSSLLPPSSSTLSYLPPSLLSTISIPSPHPTHSVQSLSPAVNTTPQGTLTYTAPPSHEQQKPPLPTPSHHHFPHNN